ncbi:MAG: hypothetical protein M3Y87_05605, partial [Myxococcota bacterium]|nr:hypothetical protein [Myxococcota bacterium]
MNCFFMRLPAIAVGLAIATVTISATSDAEAQRRRRARGAAPAEAAADPRLDEEARQLFLAGEAAYDAGRYEAALDYFSRAYALTGRPALLFNIGSVTERLRRDDEALRSYEAYLQAMPDAPNRPFVESRISFLREQVADDWRRRQRAEDAATASSDDASGAETASASAPRPPVDEEIARADDDDTRGQAEALRSPLAAGDPGVTSDDGGGGDVTGEWWFWTLVGVAVVGAGVGIGAAVVASDAGTPEAPVRGDFGPGGVVI